MTTQENAEPAGEDPADGGEGGKPMTFWEHLDELRKRLTWSVLAFFGGCFAAWGVHEELLSILTKPFIHAWTEQHLHGAPNLNFSAPGAAFTGYFRISMIGGAAMAAPFIFYQVWSFIAPGLYAKEKRYIIPFVVLSTLLFVGGGYFGWRVAFPISFNYFLGLSGPVGSDGLTITPTIMMGEYIDFCAQMLLGFGLVFEMPMLLLFLGIAGIINYLDLIKYSRYFVLVAFFVAAVLTPPDVPDQLAMAIPMCILYVVSIGLVFLFGRKPTEEQKKAFWASRKKDKLTVTE
ncbi:MAG: twin-arginine translocase subunit TatC [Byssovorax sp.]